MLFMTPLPTIHGSKTPPRMHYIVEWADRRNLKQVDLVKALGVDKGTVSRWFDGTLPRPDHLVALAEVFQIDVPALFRHPDDDWIARLLQHRSADEKQRIAQIIELTVPLRTGTDG